MGFGARTVVVPARRRAAVLMARRETGFPPDVKTIITERANGMCEIMRPGCTGRGTEHHHRMTRGMGSAKVVGVNAAANGLLACSACHKHITEHPADAYEKGWAVRRNSIVTPAESRVWWRSSRWLYLDDFGGMRWAA